MCALKQTTEGEADRHQPASLPACAADGGGKPGRLHPGAGGGMHGSWLQGRALDSASECRPVGAERPLPTYPPHALPCTSSLQHTPHHPAHFRSSGQRLPRPQHPIAPLYVTAPAAGVERRAAGGGAAAAPGRGAGAAAAGAAAAVMRRQGSDVAKPRFWRSSSSSEAAAGLLQQREAAELGSCTLCCAVPWQGTGGRIRAWFGADIARLEDKRVLDGGEPAWAGNLICGTGAVLPVGSDWPFKLNVNC